MLTVVGLGNPGSPYAKTRHNTGFMVLDGIAERRFLKEASFGSGAMSRLRDFFGTGRQFRKASGLFRSLEGELYGKRFLLVKPMTYMNDSGRALTSLMTRGIVRDLSDVLVVVDDVDLATGVLRLRDKGSAGGHNGLKSIISTLGTGDFARLRIGVGPRPNGEDMVEYVLNTFRPEEWDSLEESLEKSSEVIESWIIDGYENAQNTVSRLNINTNKS